MKRLFITLAIISIGFYGISQENNIIISGGYSFSNLEDSDYPASSSEDLKGTGWRINGTYEFNAKEGMMAYGISIGYINLSTSYEGLSGGTVDYTVSSLPIYFAPKVMFGKKKFKGFIKGALGTMSARLTRTTTAAEYTVASWGFYGGGGAGLIIPVRDNIFLKAEYEIAYASNAYYKNGWINSAMGGIGIKF